MLQSIARWLESYWAQISTLFGSLALALASILPSLQNSGGWDWLTDTLYGWFFLIGCFSSLIGGIVTISQSPSYERLQSECVRLKGELDSRKKGYSEILTDELKVLYRIVGFNSAERISLYRFEPKEEVFLMLARHSANRTFRNPGRVRFPLYQGCIWDAWENGYSFVDNLPDSTTKEYARVMLRDWNINQEEVDGMVMRSRTICAFAVEDLHDDRIAIVVFESTQPHAFEVEFIRDLMLNGEAKRISLLLDRVAHIEPDPSFAAKEDF